MPNTLGYHIVKSCYGLWLPGDDRGHWSEACDEQIGFTEPHTLDASRAGVEQGEMAHVYLLPRPLGERRTIHRATQGAEWIGAAAVRMEHG